MNSSATRRRFLRVLALGSGGATLAACSRSDPQATGGQAAATPADQAATAVRGGSITIDTGADQVLGLDPWQLQGQVSKNLGFNVAEPLIVRDQEMKLVPGLATAWKVAEDGVSWTLSLRTGVKFHDGTPFDAEAVKVNFERWMDPKGTSVVRTTFQGILDSLTIVDGSTVQIKTKGRQAAFAALLSGFGSGLVSPTAYQAQGNEIINKVIGTGPYRMEAFTPKENVTLVRNDDYWGGPPLLDRVVVKSVLEPSARTAAVVTRQVDLSIGVPPTQVSQLEAASGVRVVKQPAILVGWVSMNTTRPALQDVRVRQAINHAVNVEEIKAVVFDGLRELYQGPLPPTLYQPRPALPGYAHELDRARDLLKQASVGNLTLQYLYTSSPENDRLAQVLQGQLQKVGIQLEFNRTDVSGIIQPRTAGAYDLVIDGYGNSTGDPHPTLLANLHSSGVGVRNYARYKDSALDALIDQEGQELDTDRRGKLLADIFRRYLETIPWAASGAAVQAYAMSDRLQGFAVGPTTDLALHRLSLKPR